MQNKYSIPNGQKIKNRILCNVAVVLRAYLGAPPRYAWGRCVTGFASLRATHPPTLRQAQGPRRPSTHLAHTPKNKKHFATALCVLSPRHAAPQKLLEPRIKSAQIFAQKHQVVQVAPEQIPDVRVYLPEMGDVPPPLAAFRCP